jgi:thymidylate synthase (FAD)
MKTIEEGTLEPKTSSVRLDGFMADDISVVNSARVSFGKRIEVINDADKGLINFLMRERHGTPFEHNSFRFHVSAPIFVAREWFRHRSGWSYNEFSARYAEMQEHWYVPRLEDVRTQVGKPGAYVFETMGTETAVVVQDKINTANEESYDAYKKLISMGVAKELARTVLPVGMYTEFYATCNARSLMHFISLRGAKTAQKEIREISEMLEKFFAEKMPVTYEAFVKNGRIAP